MIVPSIVFPLFLLAVNSAGLNAATQIPGFPTDSYLTFALAVPFVQGALFATMNSGQSLAEDIENGFFNRLALTPMRGASLIAGQLGGLIVIGLLQASVYLAVGLAAGRQLRSGRARGSRPLPALGDDLDRVRRNRHVDGDPDRFGRGGAGHVPAALRPPLLQLDLPAPQPDPGGLVPDEANIVAVKAPVTFTKEELEGVPDSVLESPGVKTSDDTYTIMANVTFQYNTVEETAKKEETRKHLNEVRFNLAREKNVPVLNDMLAHRNQIALKLGYKSWDDFQTEIKMAKTGAAAKTFINDLIAGIQPKFDAEVAELRKLKVAETKDPNAQINIWDWRYFQNELKKEKYTVDTEALRVYFPFQRTLEGMFNIYQSIFGLKFTKIIAPEKWVNDLQLYMVTDAASGQPLGMFYLDMFPREGKFNHFAEFGIVPGKLLPDGKYQRPTVALLCNFPPPQKDKPSLLSHGDVETLFHEFGHALHAIVTTAKYVRFSGTSVPADFVEAPSQMLQNWVWNKKVLDTFAADYRNPSKKIPAATIAKMKEAKLATVGVFYRRQFAFADIDLDLHDVHPEAQPYDCVAMSNPILQKVFLPINPDTAFVAYFGHLAGYDAGYYGYAWADAIAADMATVFEKAPNGFLDKAAGMKLRKEIYAPGGSRDIDISIHNFLGRDRSIQPYLKTLGIETPAKPKGSPSKNSDDAGASPSKP